MVNQKQQKTRKLEHKGATKYIAVAIDGFVSSWSISSNITASELYISLANQYILFLHTG